MWQQDEEHFQRRIGTGREREAYVAYRLIAEGLEVSVPRLRVRPTFADRHSYRDSRDMMVEGREVEVKSTRFACTSPGDACLIVSQKTGAIMAVPGKTRDEWVVMDGRDHDRGIEVRWLGCPLRLARTFDEFVDFLSQSPGQSS